MVAGETPEKKNRNPQLASIHCRFGFTRHNNSTSRLPRSKYGEPGPRCPSPTQNGSDRLLLLQNTLCPQCFTWQPRTVSHEKLHPHMTKPRHWIESCLFSRQASFICQSLGRTWTECPLLILYHVRVLRTDSHSHSRPLLRHTTIPSPPPRWLIRRRPLSAPHGLALPGLAPACRSAPGVLSRFVFLTLVFVIIHASHQGNRAAVPASPRLQLSSSSPLRWSDATQDCTVWVSNNPVNLRDGDLAHGMDPSHTVRSTRCQQRPKLSIFPKSRHVLLGC
ncbi:hypothetical protein CI102_10792 [Trichoderma harzianum]|uniref:Uncharacterized protein n=1 Tax=Trichoderma harzianum CBS 226.95 TaxID=983964 RepID=A0A2T4A2I1_TRIHA|nr:hypothetical protein M431DRAFT_238868 [Trichoderma harzianum CBS 226.95]PKK43301.1 hypothetical protein CI102_10792 [Trichoderma harzianum]PTB51272.1 hypothetical protein M431DRAFT_238868 [Trichoderma harzianum CBS 226.95]